MIVTEKFKGDDNELKMEAAGAPALNTVAAALNDLNEFGYDASPFLLMLYDERRMPFSERVSRAAFVEFIKEALKRFPFTGNFDSYIFVLQALFGENSEIEFEVPAAGKFSISVNSANFQEFEFIGREPDGLGGFDTFQMVDYDDAVLAFRGVAGIETEAELALLFSEIMPAGIFPDISLTFYEYSTFVADDGSLMTSMAGDTLIFWEIGG